MLHQGAHRMTKLIKVIMKWDSTEALTTLIHGYPALQSLTATLPRWTLAQRKTLLTLARCQCTSLEKTTASNRLQAALFSRVPGRGGQDSSTIKDIISPLLGILPSSVFSGFISMLARSYPYDSYEEIEEELQSGIRKELSAAIDLPSYHL